MNIFAIGDIHGCLNQLISLHENIFNYKEFKKEEDLIIYLGDYIDRGKESKQVISEIIDLRNKGFKTEYIKGNHDEMMIGFLFNKINNLEQWLNFGADQTFRSYDIEIVDFIKDGFDDHVMDQLRKTLMEKLGINHINFFTNLKLKLSISQYLFVHAGIDPKKKLEDQTKEDYLWSRSDDFFNKEFKTEKIIVHGHTPEKDIADLPGRINVDTGCYFSGKLSCVCLNDINSSRHFISNL
tara:strand:- start:3349 stop:4065 length:717 start_codon:yes stop_codon:yes gene_type:complete